MGSERVENIKGGEQYLSSPFFSAPGEETQEIGVVSRRVGAQTVIENMADFCLIHW